MGSPVRVPFEIHFEIERNCELKCSHCSSHLIKKYDERGFSFGDIAQLIRQLNEYSVHVFFTGGEPLLSADLDDLIQHVSRQPAETHVGLFTTGILLHNGELAAITDAQARHMRALGLETCYMSIYSSDPAVHDSMTNISSSHHLTCNAMLHLLKQGIDVRFNTVVFSQNEGEINGIVEYANSIGASEVRLLKLIKHGNAIQNWERLRLSKQTHSNILSELILQNRISPRITISGHPHLAPCRPFSTSAGCEAGIRLLYVTYLGEVYPCACAKNNPNYRICHISEADKLKDYLANRKNTCRKRCLSSKEGVI